ncbi:MAG: hypothetical protein ABEJ06_01345 [Haloarculaceae archaeon]
MSKLDLIECPNCGEEIRAEIRDENGQCPTCNFRGWDREDHTI